MHRFILLVGMVVFLMVPSIVRSQSTNPDISVIGDIRSFLTTDSTDVKKNELQLELDEVEFAFQGYLNPYARADAYIAFHEGAFELEEAYGTILRGLPAGFQLKAGRYRVDFGKLNTLHRIRSGGVRLNKAEG